MWDHGNIWTASERHPNRHPNRHGMSVFRENVKRRPWDLRFISYSEELWGESEHRDGWVVPVLCYVMAWASWLMVSPHPLTSGLLFSIHISLRSLSTCLCCFNLRTTAPALVLHLFLVAMFRFKVSSILDFMIRETLIEEDLERGTYEDSKTFVMTKLD